MQAFTLKRYPAQLSLTTWMNLIGAAQTGVFALLTQHKPGVWKVGINIDLWCIMYAVRKLRKATLIALDCDVLIVMPKMNTRRALWAQRWWCIYNFGALKKKAQFSPPCTVHLVPFWLRFWLTLFLDKGFTSAGKKLHIFVMVD